MRTAIGSSTFWWTLVLVTFAIAPTRVAGQPPASSPPGCVTIYQYDVRVAAHVDYTKKAYKGDTRDSSDWQAHLTAPISVDNCKAGVVTIRTAPAAAGTIAGTPTRYTVTGGQFDVTYTYADTAYMGKNPNGEEVPPCHFTVTGHSPASVSLDYKNGVPTQFNFWVGGDRRPLADEFRAAHLQNCVRNRYGGGELLASIFLETEPTEGIRTSIGELAFGGGFSSAPTTSLETKIMSALSSGEGFKFDTGMKVVQRANGDVVHESATVSFSPPGKGAPPDFPKKSCPDTAEADAQLAKGNSQWDAYAKDLKVLWANYEEEMKKAESHLQQFQTTMRACNIQSGLTNVLIGTLGLFAPGVEAVAVAEEGTEAYEATKQAVEMLGPQVGDPAAALANAIQSLMNNEDPTAKLVPSEMFQQFTEAVEMAKNINTRISGSSLAQLEEGLQQCAGTIGLSNENWKGANDYIEELQAAMANVPASQVLVNDIKQLDNVTLPQLQYDVYAACVRHARCLNQPESSCDKLKPAGNWAPVQ